MHTHTHVRLSSGTLSSVLFVLSTYSQSQFPHQPSLLLLRVQADTSSCRLPHFWNLSNLSWESQPLSHHPGAYGPLSIYPPSPTQLSFPPSLSPPFISHPNLPVATFSASSKFCLLFSSILSPLVSRLRLSFTPPPPPPYTFRRSVLWHDWSSPRSLRCGLSIIRCVKEWQSLPALPPSFRSCGGGSNQNTGIEWGWSLKQRVTLLIEWTQWPGHHYWRHLVWSKFGFYVQTHYFSNRDHFNL